MEGNCPAAAHLARPALLGVEVVVSRSAGNYLALLGDTEALCVGFVGFHVITALLRGGDSMPDFRQNANPKPQSPGRRVPLP